MIDPYLRTLLVIITIIAATIAVMLLAMIWIRFITSINNHKYKQKEQEWQDIYLNYLLGDIDLEKAAGLIKGEKRYYWLWTFFAPYLEVLTGNDFEKTKALCREIGLIDHYRKILFYSSTAGKAIAAKALGTMHCWQSVPEMKKLLQSDNQLLIQSAVYGLARSGEKSSFIPAVKALLNSTYFTYEGIIEMLTIYGERICPDALSFLKNPTMQQATGNDKINLSVYRSLMINLLGYFKYREALPFLKEMLKDADDETSVHIFKAFLNMKSLPSNLDLKPYLEHPYWVVRNFSAQAWKLTGDREALPILEKLLSDKHWWVRFHAAEALRSAGEPGLKILNRKTADPDQKAAAISIYALNRNEVQMQI